MSTGLLQHLSQAERAERGRRAWRRVGYGVTSSTSPRPVAPTLAQLSPGDQAVVIAAREAMKVVLARRPSESRREHLARLGGVYCRTFKGDPFHLVKVQDIALRRRSAAEIKAAGRAHGASGRGVTLLGGQQPIIVLARGLSASEEREVLLHELGHVAAGGGDDSLASAFVDGWGKASLVTSPTSLASDPIFDPSLTPRERWARWLRVSEERQREEARRRAAARAR